MIPDFKTFIKESIWSDIQDRSSGDTVRKEDDVNLLDRDEFYDYLKNKYNKISHLISKNPSEINIKLGWSYFPRRDYIIDIHWVEKNKIKNLYLNFGPCELNTLCNKKFKTGTANDGISNEEILNIIDFCLGYISSHKEIESPMSPLNESIWSDIQDRSSGDTVRKEDDVDILDREQFFDYLKDIYKPTTSIYDIRDFSVTNEILVPILMHDAAMRPKSSMYVSIEYSDEDITEKSIIISKKMGNNAPDLVEKIKEEFNTEDFQHAAYRGAHIKIYPKDTSIITNSFFIKVVDFMLNNVVEPHIKLMERR